ncbi:oocyte zinc finger protein XlCOF6-like [Anabrus simplex]|uniref:oocyte zinc finger protein XlCOF6-like n=1 Tax=Anabrus simplex TaxID=316456 RepID=UPI0035A2BE9E
MNAGEFEEVMIEIHPEFDACRNRSLNDGMRTVSVDTFDLDICFVQKSGYHLGKSVAVDTSDLEEHYEFYRYEQKFRISKTISTDTHDLEYRNKPRVTVSTGVDTDDLVESFPESFCSVCNRCCKRSSGEIFNGHLNRQNGFINHLWTDSCSNKNGIRNLLSGCQTNIEVPQQNALVLSEVKRADDSVYAHNTEELKISSNRVNKTGIKELKETRPLLLRKDFQSNSRFHMSQNSVILGNEEQKNDSEVSDNNNSEDVHLDESDHDGKYLVNSGSIKDKKLENGYSDMCVKLEEKCSKQDKTKKFECDICKAAFTRKQNIVVHLQMHSLDRTFSCGDCGRTFVALNQLRTHVQSHLTGFCLFRCELCGKGFDLNEELEHHKSTHNGGESFRCSSCHQVFRLEDEFKLHCCKERQEIEDCTVCGKSFQSPTSLSHHIQIFHKMDKMPSNTSRIKTSFECLTCGKVFRCRSALKCHETVHTGERNYVCETCNKAFPTKASLKAHASTHSGLKPFICSTCGKAFAKNDSLKTHLRKHTGERPFKCDICGQAFDRNFTLKNHRVTHTGEKKNICPICGKAFATRGALSTHERTRHSSNPEKPRKPYKRRIRDFEPCVCDVCGKVYSNQANLRIHKLTHSGDKPFLCTVCGQSFAKKYTLQCHTRKHTDERPFACDICGLTFFRNHTLKTHKLRHTGERPHVCTLCGRSFIQSASLAYHIRHHDRPPRIKGHKKKKKIFGVFLYDQPSLNDNNKILPEFSQQEVSVE